MKVGKEEAMGMLMAVEMWMKRDHQAEWNQWLAWLDHISKRVSSIDGVTTSVVEPRGLSNRTPSLVIRWDRNRLGISGTTVAKHLFDLEPRIATPGGRDSQSSTETSISITPYQMSPGEEKIAADRLHALLASPPAHEASEHPEPPASDISGQWDVQIEYAASRSKHTLHLKQEGNRLEGTHQGDFVSRDLSGSIEGGGVRIRSSYGEEHGDQLSFTFTGKLFGDEMSGSLDMGEYLLAKWTGKRHQFRSR